MLKRITLLGLGVFSTLPAHAQVNKEWAYGSPQGQLFYAADTDANGLLTPAEATLQAYRSFFALDQNADRRLSVDEIEAVFFLGGENSTMLFLAGLDPDRDNQIHVSEVPRLIGLMSAMDTSDDGFVSLDEVMFATTGAIVK